MWIYFNENCYGICRFEQELRLDQLKKKNVIGNQTCDFPETV
jgi:hypothetical protein